MAPINKDRDLPNGLGGKSETDNPQESPEAEAEDLTPTPKSIRFKYLSILWFLPSFGAVWILVFEAGSVLSKPSFTSKLRAVSVEQWETFQREQELILVRVPVGRKRDWLGLVIHADTSAPNSRANFTEIGRAHV